jgi:hypothetical protein
VGTIKKHKFGLSLTQIGLKSALCALTVIYQTFDQFERSASNHIPKQVDFSTAETK